MIKKSHIFLSNLLDCIKKVWGLENFHILLGKILIGYISE